MAWRLAGLLIVTGVAFTFLLTGAFVVVGEACLLVGALAVVIAVESGSRPPANDDHPENFAPPSDHEGSGSSAVRD
jgi:hypothetical protein